MTRSLVTLLLFSYCAYAQWPTRPATPQDYGFATDNATTTLTGSVLATDLTIPVQNGLIFGQYNFVTIESEQMQACGVAANALTICAGKRGINGTAAAAHLAGALIQCDVNAANFNLLAAEVHSIELNFAAQVAANVPASPADFYQFVRLGTSPTLPQRPTLHITQGPNAVVVASDDPANNWTDLNFAAQCGGGTGTNYQSIQVGGVSVPQEATANYVSTNANLTIVPTDSSGLTTLTFTVPDPPAPTHFTGFPHAYSGPAGHCNGSTATSDFDIPPSGGALLNCHGSVPRWGGPDFAATLNEIAYLHLQLPADWVTGSTIGFSLTFWNSATTNSTTWSAKTLCAVTGTSNVFGTIPANAAQTVTVANNAAATTENYATFPPLDATNCSAGNDVWIQLQRTDSFSGEAGVVSRIVTLQETF